MIKMRFRIFASIMAVTLVFFCFHACTPNKSNNNYVTSKSTNSFSTLNDMVYWTDDSHFFVEKDGVIKSNLDYDMGMGSSHYSDPVLKVIISIL